MWGILGLIVCFLAHVCLPVAAKAAQENDLSLFEFTEEVTTLLTIYPHNPNPDPGPDPDPVYRLHLALVLVLL